MFSLVMLIIILIGLMYTWIIRMEKLTTKTSKTASVKVASETIEKDRLPLGGRYDVFKPKPVEKTKDSMFQPDLEYKFTGKEQFLDILIYSKILLWQIRKFIQYFI